MKNFLRSTEFRFIAVCLLCMTLAIVACVKTAQEIKQVDVQLKTGPPTGVVELSTNPDGTTTIKFIKLTDSEGKTYPTGTATFSAGTKFSMDGTIKIPDGGWFDVDGCRSGSLCPNICGAKTSN